MKFGAKNLMDGMWRWKTRADDENWTRDPFLTKEVLYPWATSATLSGRRDSNPRPSAWKANALSTELLPLVVFQNKRKKNQTYYLVDFDVVWGEEDSNLRSRKTTDLQSAPFGRSGISPKSFLVCKEPFFEPNVRFELTTPRLQITCSGQLS